MIRRLLLCVLPVVSLTAVTVWNVASSARAAAEPAAEAGASPLDALVELLASTDDAAIRRDVLLGMQAALEGRRAMAMPAGWPRVSRELEQGADAELRELLESLSVTFGNPAALTRFAETAGDPKAEPAARKRALAALVQRREEATFEMLLELLDDPVVQQDAIRGLAAYESDRVPEELLQRFPKLSGALQQDVIGTLSSRRGYARKLLAAVEAGAVPAAEISAFSARQLEALRDKEVTATLKRVWGSLRPTSADRRQVIAELRSQLPPPVLAKGDLSHGRLVFAKTCAGCHRLFDAGRKLGPDLTGSQRHSIDYLLENLVDPNAVVGGDFRMTVIVLESGRVLNGLVRAEDESIITLETANETVRVPVAEVEQRQRQKISFMPEKLLEKLSPEDMRDLLAYLMSPEQVPLPPGAKVEGATGAAGR